MIPGALYALVACFGEELAGVQLIGCYDGFLPGGPKEIKTQMDELRINVEQMRLKEDRWQDGLVGENEIVLFDGADGKAGPLFYLTAQNSIGTSILEIEVTLADRGSHVTVVPEVSSGRFFTGQGKTTIRNHKPNSGSTSRFRVLEFVLTPDQT